MATILQRPLKGSRISSFYPVKSLPPLSSLDSAFQLQEYISLLIRMDVHDVEAIVSMPGKQESREREGSDESKAEKDAEKEAKSEITVDEATWIYEQLRRLAQDLSHPLITMLQQECTRATCPEMKAGEWLYLCVAHGNDGAMEQCCAIDYILHTLDSATALLNSPRAFPSRLSVLPTSYRHFPSLARRLGRIFAHAYFHHREAFEQAEAESSLYARFLALTSKFNLVPSDFLVIPPRLTSMQYEGGSERGQYGTGTLTSADSRRLLGVDAERAHSQWGQEDPSLIDLSDGNSRPRPPLSSLAHGGTESPRRMGRNRTDTMVFSEAINIAEELAKAEGTVSDSELDRAISEERVLGAIDDAGPAPRAAEIKLETPDAPAPLQPAIELQPIPGAPPTQPAEPSLESVPIVTITADTPEVESPVSEVPGEATHGDILNLVEPGPAEPAIPTPQDDEDEDDEDLPSEDISHELREEALPPASSQESEADDQDVRAAAVEIAELLADPTLEEPEIRDSLTATESLAEEPLLSAREDEIVTEVKPAEQPESTEESPTPPPATPDEETAAPESSEPSPAAEKTDVSQPDGEGVGLVEPTSTPATQPSGDLEEDAESPANILVAAAFTESQKEEDAELGEPASVSERDDTPGSITPSASS